MLLGGWEYWGGVWTMRTWDARPDCFISEYDRPGTMAVRVEDGG
jgi:hypothetical protein